MILKIMAIMSHFLLQYIFATELEDLFFKKEIKYLGVIVSADGIKTDPEKVIAVQNWPAIKSIKDLRRFN